MVIPITGFTHLATGALAGIVLYRTGADVSVAAAAIAGSLLPDIDHPGSKLGRRAPVISHAVHLFGHRGVTHSLLFVLILAAAGYYAWTPAYGLAIGAAVHIAADMLTPSGVPLFWPHGRRYSLFGFRTGGIADRLIGIAASAMTILFALAKG